MRIRELTNKECLEVLARLTIDRLACSRNDQPYLVPIHFAYHQRHLYSFATHGQKIDWMRTNPLVCVEVDEIVSRSDWMSVIIQGRYEELLDTPEWKLERELTHELLRYEAMWWEPAYVGTAHLDAADELVPIYYHIHIDQVTGRGAKPDPPVPVDAATPVTPAPPTKGKNWLQALWPR